jgi:hypothetical protein
MDRALAGREAEDRAPTGASRRIKLWSSGAGDGGGELVDGGGSTVYKAMRWGRGAKPAMEGSSRRRRSARGKSNPCLRSVAHGGKLPTTK